MSIDALLSIQQLRSTFQSLAGASAGTSSTDTSSDATGASGTSAADFADLIAAFSAPSATSTDGFSDGTSALDSTSALTDASATGAVTPSGDAGSIAGIANPNGVDGADVVADAKKYLGVPYVFGGESDSGLDCSGLVQKVFKDLGVSVTRGVSTQKLQGEAVQGGLANAQPGDLIVFKGGGHIAIYAGNDMVIHAPYPGRTVSLQKLWVGDSGIETIRRFVPSGTSTTADATAATASTASTESTASTTSASSASSNGTVTLAQAQAALVSAQEAMMQADLAMMASPTDDSSSDSSSLTDPTSSLTGLTGDSSTDSTDGTTDGITDATAAAGATDTSDTAAASTDAIQQFIAAQEALMTGATS